MAERIGNLIGHLEFTDDQLQRTDKGLKDSGVAMPNFGNGWNDAQMSAIEEEEREDILGFWSRFQRSIASDEDREDDDEDNAAGSEDESDWSTDDDEDVDDDEDEEEDFKDFSLLGRK